LDKFFFLKVVGRGMRKPQPLIGYCLVLVVISLVLIISSAFIQSFLLPEQLKLSPGQKMILSVTYPLSFQIPHLMRAEMPFLTRNLVVGSRRGRNYQVQLKLFGKIPIKKLKVMVADPPLVVPGGQAIGVVFSSQGVMVVGMLPVIGVDRRRYYPAKNAGLQPGDILLEIDRAPVNHVEEIEYFLRNYRRQQHFLTLTVKRDHKTFKLKIRPVLTGDGLSKRYMLGIFVDEPSAGVGTLSFYDPEKLSFAGLGHRITRVGGKNGLLFKQGEIVLANISGIRRGLPGKPGEKLGVFYGSQFSMGQIVKNTAFGIYGTLNKNYPISGFKPIPAAFNSQVKVGRAQIYTVIRGCRIEKFKVRIIKVFRQRSPRDKGLIIKVTDPTLLRKTGGIIQGMSGSPIVQNGKLVGAVTHVFVNDPTKGYGVLAEWMLQEMDSRLVSSKEAS
jgi:stage IV sporulation protein B